MKPCFFCHQIGGFPCKFSIKPMIEGCNGILYNQLNNGDTCWLMLIDGSNRYLEPFGHKDLSTGSRVASR